MHIAYYVPSWPPEGSANGIVTYAARMREAMIALGHSATIVAGNMAHLSDGSTLHLHHGDTLLSKSLRKLAGWNKQARRELPDLGPRLARQMKQLNAAMKIDVIEMEESFGWARTVQQAMAVPVAVRLHGPHFLAESDARLDGHAALSARRTMLEGMAITEAPLLTAPSPALLAATVEKYGRSTAKHTAIPNPIDIPDDRKRWSSDRTDEDLVLFVGRFDQPKGADLLLRSFAEVVKARPRSKLAIAGPDNGIIVGAERLKFEAYVNRFVPQDARASMRFFGVLRPNELLSLRQRAALTVACSRHETFSYTIAEAMALGCPVVATRTFGMAERIVHGTTGWLVDTDDSEQLTSAIVTALSQPEQAKRIGAAARTLCKNEFSSLNIAKRFVDYYRTVL